MGATYVIWSNQHGAWWRPRSRGYTTMLDEAGRYERAAAAKIVADATLDGQLTRPCVNAITGEEYLAVDEVMLLAPEWTDTVGSAFDEALDDSREAIREQWQQAMRKAGLP